MTTNAIQVAVIGGGIGGLCLAISLLKQPHVKVQIYEAAHKFSEIGAGIAVSPNAIRTLKLIGPDAEQAYQRLATPNQWEEMKNVWFEYRFGEGPREGEFIAAPHSETGQSTVHRAKFLEEFVKLIPEGVAHFGKRLDRIEELDKGGLVLHFKDGTTATADCVIGADGVHSVTRKHLLGENHPALNARFTASVAYRGLIPMKDAVAAIGERYAQNAMLWAGHGGSVMTYPIDFGETMNIVVTDSTYNDWDGPWVQRAQFSKIAEGFSGWGKTPQAIIKLLDNPDTSSWSLWDHPPAPTYCKGNVAMMGDAAYASTPFQGQGAGQAIEDAFVLGSLFASVDTVAKIPMAFLAYDRIRRPRSQRVAQTSREAGELVALRLPGVGDNVEAIKENLDWRMDWIWHRDIAGMRDEALVIFQKLLDGGKVYY